MCSSWIQANAVLRSISATNDKIVIIRAWYYVIFCKYQDIGIHFNFNFCQKDNSKLQYVTLSETNSLTKMKRC